MKWFSFGIGASVDIDTSAWQQSEQKVASSTYSGTENASESAVEESGGSIEHSIPWLKIGITGLVMVLVLIGIVFVMLKCKKKNNNVNKDSSDVSQIPNEETPGDPLHVAEHSLDPIIHPLPIPITLSQIESSTSSQTNSPQVQELNVPSFQTNSPNQTNDPPHETTPIYEVDFNITISSEEFDNPPSLIVTDDFDESYFIAPPVNGLSLSHIIYMQRTRIKPVVTYAQSVKPIAFDPNQIKLWDYNPIQTYDGYDGYDGYVEITFGSKQITTRHYNPSSDTIVKVVFGQELYLNHIFLNHSKPNDVVTFVECEFHNFNFDLVDKSYLLQCMFISCTFINCQCFTNIEDINSHVLYYVYSDGTNIYQYEFSGAPNGNLQRNRNPIFMTSEIEKNIQQNLLIKMLYNNILIKDDFDPRYYIPPDNMKFDINRPILITGNMKLEQMIYSQRVCMTTTGEFNPYSQDSADVDPNRHAASAPYRIQGDWYLDDCSPVEYLDLDRHIIIGATFDQELYLNRILIKYMEVFYVKVKKPRGVITFADPTYSIIFNNCTFNNFNFDQVSQDLLKFCEFNGCVFINCQCTEPNMIRPTNDRGSGNYFVIFPQDIINCESELPKVKKISQQPILTRRMDVRQKIGKNTQLNLLIKQQYIADMFDPSYFIPPNENMKLEEIIYLQRAFMANSNNGFDPYNYNEIYVNPNRHTASAPYRIQGNWYVDGRLTYESLDSDNHTIIGATFDQEFYLQYILAKYTPAYSITFSNCVFNNFNFDMIDEKFINQFAFNNCVFINCQCVKQNIIKHGVGEGNYFVIFPTDIIDDKSELPKAERLSQQPILTRRPDIRAKSNVPETQKIANRSTIEISESKNARRDDDPIKHCNKQTLWYSSQSNLLTKIGFNEDLTDQNINQHSK